MNSPNQPSRARCPDTQISNMGNIKKTLFPIFVLTACVFVSPASDRSVNSPVYAQEGIGAKDDAAVKLPMEEERVTPPAEPVKEKAPVKKTPEEALKKNDHAVGVDVKKKEIAENPKPAPDAPPGEGILLNDDGPFRFARIPGYRAPDIAAETVAADEKKEIGSLNENETGPDQGPRGLFGMSRKSTDLLAKGVLAGIILLIVVLYRIRTKSRRSSVLKRFPKA